MFEKRLFYAFAALLCLVLAYHVGARNAGAQGTGQTLVAHLDECSRPDHVIYATQQERVVRFASSTNACSEPQSGPVGPVPGTSPIIMVEQGCGIWIVVVLEDGSVYTQQPGDGAWTFGGNLLCGPPVKTNSETWGELKSRFRTGK